MFKRRDRRPILKALLDFFWPKGGWSRAFQYIKHRLRRLPDTPQRIARGVCIGVFTTFTPFYGFHFIFAAVMAKILNGNMLAALLGTFFGNPLTYLPIGLISLQTGHFLLGKSWETPAEGRSLGGKFSDAWRDLRDNLFTLFTDQAADWSNLVVFYQEVFFPYMIGGIAPGLIVSLISYYLSLTLVITYRKRRRGFLREKLLSLKKKKPTIKKKGSN